MLWSLWMVVGMGALAFAGEGPPLELKAYFGEQDAAMVLHDVRRNVTRRYGGGRCEERLTPCSTFKI